MASPPRASIRVRFLDRGTSLSGDLNDARYKVAGAAVHIKSVESNYEAIVVAYDLSVARDLAQAEAELGTDLGVAVAFVGVITNKDVFVRTDANRAALEIGPATGAWHFVLDSANGEKAGSSVGRELARRILVNRAVTARGGAGPWVEASPYSPQALFMTFRSGALLGALGNAYDVVWQAMRPVMIFTTPESIQDWYSRTGLPATLASRGIFVFSADTDWATFNRITRVTLRRADYRGRVLRIPDGTADLYAFIGSWLSGRRLAKPGGRRMLFSGLITNPEAWDGVDNDVADAIRKNVLDEQVLATMIKRADPGEPRLGHFRAQVFERGASDHEVLREPAARLGAAHFAATARHVSAMSAGGFDRAILLAAASHYTLYVAMQRPIIPRDGITRRAAPPSYSTSFTGLGAGSFGCVVAAKIGRDHPRVAELGRGQAVALKVEKLTGPAYEAQILGVAARLPDEMARMSPFVPDVYASFVLKPTRETRVATRAFTDAVEAACRGFVSPAAQKLGPVSGALDPWNEQWGTLVMEMPVYASTLGSASRRPDMDALERTSWSLQLVHGLVALAESIGFLHNDIKPENTFVRAWSGPDDRILVVRHAAGNTTTLRVRAKNFVVLGDVGASTATLIPDLTPEARGMITERRMWGWYPGTQIFQSPTVLTFVDPDDYDLDTRSGWFAQTDGVRGMASDIWALGLTLTSVWASEVLRELPQVKTHQINQQSVIVSGSLPAVNNRIVAIADDIEDEVFGDEAGWDDGTRRVHEITFATTGGRQWSSRLALMMRAFALNWAFNGTPPDQEDAGPIFAAVEAHAIEIKEALLHWRDGDTQTPFEFLAEKMQRDVPDVHDFLRQCLAWDPRERVAFFASGEVFAHPAFRAFQTTSEAVQDTATPENTYILDLLS